MSDVDEVHRLARELYDQAEGNARRLATLAAQYAIAAKAKAGGSLDVVGSVSFQTGKPFVQTSWGENVGQLDVDAARGHAMLILEAAQNAVADAAILGWAKDELKVDQERGAHLIDSLRRYRADHWGQPDLDVEFQREPPPEEP